MNTKVFFRFFCSPFFSLRFQLGNSFVNTKVVFSVFFPFYVFVLELKKKKDQMVDFLTKPSRKMQKNNRAKGVTLKTPDIKIIMYVYTPLNKVFGFQGSNQIIGG